MRRLICRLRGHRWVYGGTGPWTGYLEICERCRALQQIVQ